MVLPSTLPVYLVPPAVKFDLGAGQLAVGDRHFLAADHGRAVEHLVALLERNSPFGSFQVPATLAGTIQ